MLNWIIETSLRHRLAVVLGTLAFAAAGVWSMRHLDIDAFPDTTPVQVQVNTVAPALGPEEVEQQITFPVEQALSGLPRLRTLRSVSKFGFSQVVLVFEDDTDIYFARQVVNERLGCVHLPVGIDRPKMGPTSTGLDEVFHYVVTGQGDDPTHLRTVHNWIVKPQMRTVPGSLLLPKKIAEREPLLMRLAHAVHAPILRLCMNHKLAVVGFALCLLVEAFGMIAPNLGSEFVPRLSEGAVVVNVVRLAGTDLDESIRSNTEN